MDAIRRHFDPIAALVDNNVVITYGLAASDFMRLVSHFSKLSQYGLVLVDRRNSKFRFLVFKEIVIGVYTGFRETMEEMGLSFAFDFQLKDLSKLDDCESMSKWVTLKDLDKLKAESLARSINTILKMSRLEGVLGPRAIEVIRDLMWETNAFEPLHAANIIARANLANMDLYSLTSDLRNIGVDLRHMANSKNRVLFRKKSRMTLMDCARFLFSEDNYCEAESSKLSRSLGIPENKLSSHFRGYLIVDEEYVKRLFEASN